MSDVKCSLLKPFGSTILKSELPDDLVKDFSNDLSKIRQDPKLVDEHKFGHKLAGNLYKELLISHDTMLKWNFEDKFVSPDISTVGYIKLPQSMSEYKHTKPHHSVGGFIEFMEGTEDIFTNANYLLQPILKDFYIFPSSLRHAVYPFHSSSDTDERISFSFNAKVVFSES